MDEGRPEASGGLRVGTVRPQALLHRAQEQAQGSALQLGGMLIAYRRKIANN